MSGDPQQPPTCCECNKPKEKREHKITQRDKTEQGKKKSHHGNVGGEDYGADYNNEDSTLSGEETEVLARGVFDVCSTPGCPQRGKDLWRVKEWELENNPKLDNSYEAQEREKQRIQEKEAKLAEDMNYFSENNQIRNNDRNNRKRGSYGESKNNIETYSTHQSARDSTNQSDIRSRRSQDQNAATEWSDTPNKDIPWSNKQAQASGWSNTDDTDTNASEQDVAEATAGDDTPWGNPRESDTDSREQDSTKSTGTSTTETTNNSSDTEEETTVAAEAFEKSVHGDGQTDSQGSTMANESPKGESRESTADREYNAQNENDDEGDSQPSRRRSW